MLLQVSILRSSTGVDLLPYNGYDMYTYEYTRYAAASPINITK
jgi:hypothetical protein